MKDKKEKWIKEFDKFVYKSQPVGAKYKVQFIKGEVTGIMLKKFISRLLKAQREELKKKVLV